MKRDEVPDIAYSLRQEEQISSMRGQIIDLKDLLGAKVVQMMKDIIHSRLEIRTIRKIRDICNDALGESIEN